MRIWISGLVSGLAALAVAGCASEDWGPDEMLSGGSRLEQAVLAKGKHSYLTYCVGCHGDKGDGNGPAARFLDPKPRDLRKGRVKFAAVTSVGLPRDEDLAITLQHGLSGTSMPSWALIPGDESAALVTYIKTFHEGFAKKGAGTAIVIEGAARKPALDARARMAMLRNLHDKLAQQDWVKSAYAMCRDSGAIRKPCARRCSYGGGDSA